MEHQYTSTEIKERFDEVSRKTLGQIDEEKSNGRDFQRTIENPKITGIAGDVIEHSILGYGSDTKQEADIEIDGKQVEVKTTGLTGELGNPESYKAKERITITNISPHKLVKETFETSSLWNKLENTFLVYYLYDSKKPVKAAEYANFPYLGYQLHEFPETDLKTIMNDWKIIQDFCLAQDVIDKKNEAQAKAYSAAKKSMMYLETAPGWKNGPRFALKQSYVTSIIKEHFTNQNIDEENNISSYAELDAFLSANSKKYQGRRVGEIAKELGIASSSKAVASKLIRHILEPNTGDDEVGIVEKSGMVIKARTMYSDGRKKEDCKFFTLDFDEFRNADGDVTETEAYRYFDNNQFIFPIFKKEGKAKTQDDTFVGFKRFSFSEEYLEEHLKPVLQQIQDLVANHKFEVTPKLNKAGEPIINKKTGTQQESNNLPKSRYNNFFLRGTSSDSTHKPLELNGYYIYNQQIWLKGQELLKLLDDVEYI
ncbi:MutH/Sau3AI family endonuclease [Weissella viridescens]